MKVLVTHEEVSKLIINEYCLPKETEIEIKLLEQGNPQMLTITTGKEAVNDLIDSLRPGQVARLTAIKALRVLTGLGLKDAKDIIDQIAPHNS